MINVKYQLMPEMSADQYEALKADIKERGVMTALEYDDKGNLLDGHHRLKACLELGISAADIPKVTRYFATEEEKRYHIRAINAYRRHMTPEQRRQVIAEQLKDAPQKSDRQIAAGLGVSHHTVGAQREKLESTGQIAQLETSIGADGKERPRQAERKPVELESANEFDEGQIDIEETFEPETESDGQSELAHEIPTRTPVLDLAAFQKKKEDEEYDKFMDGGNKHTKLNRIISQIEKLNFTKEDVEDIMFSLNRMTAGMADDMASELTRAIKILQEINRLFYLVKSKTRGKYVW